MSKLLSPPDRLIVAADFKIEHPVQDPREFIRLKVLKLADSLSGTGVVLKVNSALRICGYPLISEIHARGLQVFADLKLYDIPETVSTDGALLSYYKPEIVTTVCAIGTKGLRALKALLPNAEVLGVTVLTSLGDDDTAYIHGGSVVESVRTLAALVRMANLDGIVCSPKEITSVKGFAGEGKSIVTPGIRLEWTSVAGDDQNPDRTMTAYEAIDTGATRIVVGRPITRAGNPREATLRTLEEITAVLEKIQAE